MICFFNDTATTEIYTLSLHDALPIFYPSDRIHYAEMGRGSRTTLRVREDGTFSDRGDDRERDDRFDRGDRVEISGRDGLDASDRKSTRLNSSHANISYAVFCLKKKIP